MDDRADQLRALELMIGSCRAKAAAHGVPSLIQILDRAGSSLSDHAARAGDLSRIPRDRTSPLPRTRPVRH